MLKTIYLAGVPCSGKTEIMREVRKRLFTTTEAFKYGKARGIRSGNIWAVGEFDGSRYEGIDPLSKYLILDAITFVQRLHKDSTRNVLLLEGDRLFCERFLRTARATVIVVDAAESILYARHKMRQDKQTLRRLKICRTKVENFCQRHNVLRVFNNTPGDMIRIVEEITRIATEYLNEPISTSQKTG